MLRHAGIGPIDDSPDGGAIQALKEHGAKIKGMTLRSIDSATHVVKRCAFEATAPYLESVQYDARPEW
jgi:hypothetical protein